MSISQLLPTYARFCKTWRIISLLWGGLQVFAPCFLVPNFAGSIYGFIAAQQLNRRLNAPQIFK